MTNSVLLVEITRSLNCISCLAEDKSWSIHIVSIHVTTCKMLSIKSPATGSVACLFQRVDGIFSDSSPALLP